MFVSLVVEGGRTARFYIMSASYGFHERSRRSFSAEPLERRLLLSQQRPFWGTPIELPATVQVEDFDKGGAEVAYHDTTDANFGHSYRISDGVDILPDPTASGNHVIGYTRAGEWTEYSITTSVADQFRIITRLSSGSSGGSFHLEIDGVDVSGSRSITNTGGWTTGTNIKTNNVFLSKGSHLLRLVVDSARGSGGVANFDWIRFVPQTMVPVGAVQWPGSWHGAAANPAPRFESYGFSMLGKLYVMGGWADSDLNSTTRADAYDPKTNTWTRLSNMQAPETHAGCAPDPENGVVYFVEGHRGKYPSTPTNECWRYNVASDTWTQMPKVPGDPGGAGAAVVIGNELHYFGGCKPDRVTNIGNHRVLNLDHPELGWHSEAAMPNRRDHLSAVAIGDNLYAIGGEHGHDKLHVQQNAVEVYNINTDTWSEAAPMPFAHSHAESSTFVYNGRIYAAGGQIDTNTNIQQPTAQAAVYDPSLNRWTRLADLPAPRQGTTIQVVAEQIVFSVGGIDTLEPQSSTWVGPLS
jgi:N-acetylneuraminic acid mutarotase